MLFIFLFFYMCEDKLRLFCGLFFSGDEDIIISSGFSYDGKTVNVYTTVTCNGKLYDDDYYYPAEKIENPAMEKKIFDSAVTKSFCHAAMKIKKINLPWGVMSGIRPAKNVREFLESGIKKDELMPMLSKLYEVEPEKAQLAMTVAENEKEILKKAKPDSVSIYVGIPFCPTRCLYCSFVSTDVRVSGKYMDEYLKLLLVEIDKTAEIIKCAGKRVQNIYIGGGTPTTLSAEQLFLLLDKLKSLIPPEGLDEFTLEAGRPDTITAEKLISAKKGGVTRISINPQTMNGKTLVRVGRAHTPQMAVDSFRMARDAGFDNINMDLIAGLPGENLEDFIYTVDKVSELDPENITVHSMCIKKSADFRFSGEELAAGRLMNSMLSYAQNKMKETGRVPYYMYRQKNISGNLENVGYSKPGYMSFYNINIMEETQTIIAVGCGGSTKVVKDGRISRIFNFKDPKTYIDRFDEILGKKDEVLELMGRKEETVCHKVLQIK